MESLDGKDPPAQERVSREGSATAAVSRDAPTSVAPNGASAMIEKVFGMTKAGVRGNILVELLVCGVLTLFSCAPDMDQLQDFATTVVAFATTSPSEAASKLEAFQTQYDSLMAVQVANHSVPSELATRIRSNEVHQRPGYLRRESEECKKESYQDLLVANEQAEVLRNFINEKGAYWSRSDFRDLLEDYETLLIPKIEYRMNECASLRAEIDERDRRSSSPSGPAIAAVREAHIESDGRGGKSHSSSRALNAREKRKYCVQFEPRRPNGIEKQRGYASTLMAERDEKVTLEVCYYETEGTL